MALSIRFFAGYHPKWDDIQTNPHGSLIAHETGTSTSYALLMSQERGEMFIGPGVKVYEGQVVGQNAKAEDIIVNVCKQKQLNNFRAKTEQVTNDLIPPRVMSLEQCLEYLGDDELLEITPKSLRLRKRVLRNMIRKNWNRAKKRKSHFQKPKWDFRLSENNSHQKKSSE